MGSASDGDSVGDCKENYRTNVVGKRNRRWKKERKQTNNTQELTNVGYPSAFQASPFQTGEEVGLAEMNTASVGLSVELC
jgi:hypothetical protein